MRAEQKETDCKSELIFLSPTQAITFISNSDDLCEDNF